MSFLLGALGNVAKSFLGGGGGNILNTIKKPLSSLMSSVTGNITSALGNNTTDMLGKIGGLAMNTLGKT